MESQRTAQRAPSTPAATTKATGIGAAAIRLWRRRGGSRSGSPNAGWEQRLETLAARVEHLEAELEGLQDAVYRQAVLEQENIVDLRKRTEPERIARDLGENARRRGL